MTEEQKKVEECKHCDCCKMVGKFFFISGAVFLGTLFAFLLAHSLTKPSFPPCRWGMMPPHHPRIERQMPPISGDHVRKLNYQSPKANIQGFEKKNFKRIDQRPQIPNFNQQENR